MNFVKKTIWSAMALTALCLFVNPVYSIDKVAIVKLDEVVKKTPMFEVRMKRLESEFTGKIVEIQEEIQPLEKQKNEKLDKLKRDASVLSKAEKEKIEKEVSKLNEVIVRKAQQFDEYKAARALEEQTALMNSLEGVLKRIASAHGYTLVLNSAVVLYQGKTPDLTAEVISALNASNKQ